MLALLLVVIVVGAVIGTVTWWTVSDAQPARTRAAGSSGADETPDDGDGEPGDAAADAERDDDAVENDAVEEPRRRTSGAAARLRRGATSGRVAGPATVPARADAPPEPADDEGRISIWRRLRALVGLAFAGLLIGAGLAVAVGVALLLAAAALERAVG